LGGGGRRIVALLGISRKPHLKNKLKAKKGLRHGSSGRCKVLKSIPSTAKKKKKEFKYR
jgi:hypothetical protein